MKKLKVSQAVGILVLTLQIAGIVAFALSFHTMLGVYISAIPSEKDVEVSTSDPVIITVKIKPDNPGYFGAKISVNLCLKSGEKILISNSSSLTVNPKSAGETEIPLVINVNDAEEYWNNRSDIDCVADIRVTTLFDLVVFRNKITVSGEIIDA
jgi:LEA14-like dessication related protein